MSEIWQSTNPYDRTVSAEIENGILELRWGIEIKGKYYHEREELFDRYDVKWLKEVIAQYEKLNP